MARPRRSGADRARREAFGLQGRLCPDPHPRKSAGRHKDMPMRPLLHAILVTGAKTLLGSALIFAAIVLVARGIMA